MPTPCRVPAGTPASRNASGGRACSGASATTAPQDSESRGPTAGTGSHGTERPPRGGRRDRRGGGPTTARRTHLPSSAIILTSSAAVSAEATSRRPVDPLQAQARVERPPGRAERDGGDGQRLNADDRRRTPRPRPLLGAPDHHALWAATVVAAAGLFER